MSTGIRLLFGGAACLLLTFLELELEAWGGLTPADDLGYSLLDEEADLRCAGNPGSSSLDEEASC
jgi:hypothetical protein